MTLVGRAFAVEVIVNHVPLTVHAIYLILSVIGITQWAASILAPHVLVAHALHAEL